MAILPDVVGKTIDDFEIKALIGMGAMGAVYKAVHVIERYEVALKVLPVSLAEDRENLKRFQREAQTVAALVHPHIVQVYGYGSFEGMSYIVMKHLPGRTLLHWIYDHRGKLTPLDDVVVWLNAIASALDYAHQHGVIHRDIKPNNIMFDDKGHLYVVDFGIAKVTHATSTLTETGTKLGTPQYMAPEQWMAQQAVPATDQYAVGAMIYHMVTGEMPFVAETPLGLLHLHLNERPKPPHQVREDVSPELEGIINAAMAKSSDYRFSTITSFARAFEEVIETGTYTGTLPSAPDTLPLGLQPQNPSIETIRLPDTVENDPVLLEEDEDNEKRRRPAAAYFSIVAVVLTLVIIFGLVLFLGDGGEDDPTREAQNASTETPSATATMTPFDEQSELLGGTEVALAANEESTPTDAPTETDEPTASTEPSETPDPTETHTLEPSPTETAIPTETLTATPTLTLTTTITLTPTTTPSITPTPTPFFDQAELLKAISVYPDPLGEEPRTFAAAQRSGFAPFVVGRSFVPDEDDDDELVEWYFIYYYDRGSARAGRGELSEGWSHADELDFDEDDLDELDIIDPENVPDLPEEFEYHVRAERPYGGGVVAATNVPSGGTTTSGGNSGGNTGGGGGGGPQPTAPPGQPTYTPIPPPSISVSVACRGNILAGFYAEYTVTNNGGPMTASAPYNVTWPGGGSSSGNLSLGAGQSTSINTGSSLLGGSHNLTITMPDGPISSPANCP